MKKSLSVAATTVAILFASVATAAPANADTASRKRCISAEDMCIWAKKGFSGSQWAVTGEWGGQCTNPLMSGHSVANGRAGTVRFYSKKNCRGSFFDIKKRDYATKTPFAVASYQGKPAS
ncbi:peptidase inhibitor family I36 protein [Streptomyces sp. NPDC050844]|uniref:peptidase inhibitor family I36 protein n=1 Tax=Streptomyces sp. NPDC050844 TaxID=3155790 RepID=UPI0033DBB549